MKFNIMFYTDNMRIHKASKPYFVYLIECEDNSIYTGIATDVARRFKEHASQKGARYTRSHKALKIIHTEACKTRSEALKREAEIKKWPRDKKLSFVSVSGIKSKKGVK